MTTITEAQKDRLTDETQSIKQKLQRVKQLEEDGQYIDALGLLFEARAQKFETLELYPEYNEPGDMRIPFPHLYRFWAKFRRLVIEIDKVLFQKWDPEKIQREICPLVDQLDIAIRELESHGPWSEREVFGGNTAGALNDLITYLKKVRRVINAICHVPNRFYLRLLLRFARGQTWRGYLWYMGSKIWDYIYKFFRALEHRQSRPFFAFYETFMALEGLDQEIDEYIDSLGERALHPFPELLPEPLIKPNPLWKIVDVLIKIDAIPVQD